VWTIQSVGDGSVTLAYRSPDGEGGYPGNLTVTATYALSEANELSITYNATTDRPTIVNVTNHSFFNLAGERAATDALGALLTLHAGAYTPVDEGLIPTGDQAVDGLVLVVEGPGLLLELLEDLVRVQSAEIRQDDDVLAIEDHRVVTGWVDDDGAIVAHLLLQARMAVVPIGPRLPDAELVDEGLARLDAREADAGHTVHLEGQQQAVPVDRGFFVKRVGHRQADVLALPQPDQRSRNRAVDRHGMGAYAVHCDGRVADGQPDVLARERRRALAMLVAVIATPGGAGPARQQTRQSGPAAQNGEGLQESTAIECRTRLTHDCPLTMACSEGP
jgi:hypothetical protein